MIKRCHWVKDDPLLTHYHDSEWGVPEHDDRRLFEFLLLGGVQAGLSWGMILHKREHYRQVFDNFDPVKVSRYDEKKISELLIDSRIVRNEQKIRAAINNASTFLKIQDEYGTFDAYIWRFVDSCPIRNKWDSQIDIPTTTPESSRMSLDLKQRGFKFVGSTICYAFMQAVGMVNDHVVDCFRYSELQ